MDANPSADKFGPPPEQATRERELARSGGKAGGALGTTGLIVGVTALRIISHTRRGWVGAAAGFLIMAGYGVQFVLTRRRQTDDPYSPPTKITR